MEFKYISKIKELLETIEACEIDLMEKTVSLLTETALNKHSIFIFGASHAGILVQEMFYRAGGLMLINPIFGREIMLDTSPVTHTSRMERLPGYGKLLAENNQICENDVLIVHSVSGRNPVAIELAMEAKKKKAAVVCITNMNYSKAVQSRHPSGKKLYQVSDIVIDNHGEKGDSCIKIDGVEQKVSPTSTVIGAAILNSIVAATAQELVNNGLNPPPIFYSANIDGGDEFNSKLFAKYKDCIHYRL